MKRAYIAIDGASKGNPGPAGIGVIISDESGNVLREISESIGSATNNFAEYSALLRALSAAREMGLTNLHIQTDSELMARQINGRYRVRNESIIPLYEAAVVLMGKFDSVRLVHVLRDKNQAADKLASKAASSAGPVQGSLSIEMPSAISGEKTPLPPDEKRREVGLVHRIRVRTSSRSQFVDITHDVQEAVKSIGIADGLCMVFVPHTTAGVTINENADPDVVMDIIDTLNRLVPQSNTYRHAEGNADSHVKASMMGFSATVPVENGRLLLGTWQGIYLCEFDGPRSREVYVRAA